MAEDFRTRGDVAHHLAGWRVRVFLPLMFLLCPSLLFADIIYLKNGGKIVAPVTREDTNHVFYEMGGGEFALPRSLVERIEKSKAAPAPQGGSQTGRELPLELPAPPEAAGEEGSAVIHDGAVDEAYLRRLASEAAQRPSPENLHQLKRAYQQAAVFLTRQGDPDAAILKYREAIKALPHDQALTLALGYLLTKQDHYLEALDLLRPEADRYPHSGDFHVLLGSDYYGMEDLDQALGEWNKALALEDNPRLREAVEKVERERDVSGSYSELRSEHFLLRYEGEQAEKLSGEILNSLEGSFQNLTLDLDYSPSEVIVVILYPSQAFRDITRSPGWVGALNDGKIRVPISGLTVVTPELARVLKHELTHSFIRQITVGRCPTWFNEGVAQIEEGSTTAALGTQLARALATGKIPALAALEGPFVDLPKDQVGFVYAKSLAAIEYLRDTFGMGEVRRILKLLPSSDFNALLQNELRLSYPAFEQEVTTYIVKRYGS
jgi:tetratricopeptide (TPR) repeat protein